MSDGKGLYAMKKSKLKAAVALGTAALLWSIPSLNIFGIIAMIISWGAYGGGRKKDAMLSGIFYIAALIVSVLFGILLSLAANDFTSSEFAPGLSSLMRVSALLSVFGDILYLAAAVFSFMGARELTGSEGKGYFD